MNSSDSPNPLVWYFPLNRPHVGVPLGNGVQGVLIWGEDTLRLTVARAGFWDHRNGQDIPPTTTFAGVRRALETGDNDALAALFPKRAPGAPFPQQMGGGRLELTFPDGLRPIDATLDLAAAEVVVQIASEVGAPAMHALRIRQTSEEEICWIEGDAALLGAMRIELQPAYDLMPDHAMAALGIAPPSPWTAADEGGFVQSLPADDPLAVAWCRAPGLILLATRLGIGAEAEVKGAMEGFDARAADATRASYWTAYWSRAARVILPDAILQQQYDYGLYRQAGLIRRHAPAATLQGPWMEDTRIPPWSNDYHFNINVQLVYGAALATGQAEEMRPLWDMLRGWIPRFRKLGESFYEIPGAMLLPHAVDDRCQMMGSFWAGAIDQACLSWMGQMAWQCYRYTAEVEHLREIVFPLLEGAFLGYWAMLEKIGEPGGGYRYAIPISVSPEFGGSDPRRCWGRDASFQLAALRMTVDLLLAAASALGRTSDPRWIDVLTHLPHYSTIAASDGSYAWIGEPKLRIALWEGQDLPESHRHHSHLAAIHPFRTIEPFDPPHRNIVARSLNRWNTMGAGNWTGWCLPWASILCSRCGLADAAQSWLHILAEQFTNEGHATLHNADGAGVFGWDDGSLAWPDHRKGADYAHYETMQMDAAMGAVTAILEMLVSVRNGVVHLADRLPKGWRELSFTRMRVEGGFLLDATFRHGRVKTISVLSPRGGPLRLAHHLGPRWQLDDQPRTERILSIDTAPGQQLQLRRSQP